MHFSGWQTEQAGATAAGGWKQAGVCIAHCACTMRGASGRSRVFVHSVLGTVIGRVGFVCVLLL